MPTTPFDFVSLSSTFGLIATGLLTLNLLLGVLISIHVRRVPERLMPVWRRMPARVRHVGLYSLHNWTAYAALAVALVHPALLLLDREGRFSLLNILVPLTGPHQRYIYSLGAVALYGLLAVVVTSTAYVRAWFSNRVWKWVHAASYAAAALFLVHGLWADPLLLDRPVDFLDAEKVLSEAGILLLVVSGYYRIRSWRAKRASERFYTLRVVGRADETETAASFVLEVPPALQPAFRYEPGQFVTLLLRRGDALVKRSYSLTSAPETGPGLQITVKRLGPVSDGLVDSVHVGDEIEVLPPEGSFFRGPVRKATDYLLFAAGSGITPFVSIAASVLATRPEARITLIYANSDERSVMLMDRLDRLQRRSPDRFSVVHVLSRPAADWRGRAGRLTAGTLDRLVGEVHDGAADETEHLICGPDGFITLVEAVLRRREVSPARVHAERFTFASEDADQSPEGPLEVGDAPVAPSGRPSRLTVRVDGETRTTDVHEGETVLDAVLRTGIVPPFACQQGVCASCKATLLRGRVRMSRHEALTPLEVDQRCVLSCTAVPLSSDVSVEFGSAARRSGSSGRTGG